MRNKTFYSIGGRDYFYFLNGYKLNDGQPKIPTFYDPNSDSFTTETPEGDLLELDQVEAWKKYYWVDWIK